MHVRTNLKAGQGLGDAVATLTQLTGMQQLAQAYTQVTGQDCGCQQRQNLLNQWIPNLSPSLNPPA